MSQRIYVNYVQFSIGEHAEEVLEQIERIGRKTYDSVLVESGRDGSNQYYMFESLDFNKQQQYNEWLKSQEIVDYAIFSHSYESKDEVQPNYLRRMIAV